MTTYEGTPFEKFAKQALGPPAQDIFDFGIGRMFGLLDEARDQVRELRCAPDGPHVVALIELLAAIRQRVEGLEMEVRATADALNNA